jgi:type II secretion system protein N
LLLAGYGVFAAILFVGFVLASFPYADTLSVLLAPVRLKVVFERKAMNFPIGARLQNIRLFSLAGEQLLLQSPDVTVAPGIGWFLLGQPCLVVRAQIYGGLLKATVRYRGRSIMADFELESLNLARLSARADEPRFRSQGGGDEDSGAAHRLGILLSGELSGSGSARLSGQEIAAGSASAVLSGHGVRAVLVDGLPPLDLGVVRGKVALEKGVVVLEDLRADGSDGILAATGEIWLAPDIAHSIVQLTLSLEPTSKGRTSFGLLMNMLPHPPDEGPYHLQGLVTSPSLS